MLRGSLRSFLYRNWTKNVETIEYVDSAKFLINRIDCSPLIAILSLGCGCNVTGSQDNVCAKYEGQCKCKPGVTGRKCDACLPGYFNFTSNGCTGELCNADSYVFSAYFRRLASYRHFSSFHTTWSFSFKKKKCRHDFWSASCSGVKRALHFKY